VLPSQRPEDNAVLAELGQALGLKAPPLNIECFDISHISGTFCVASMVHFTAGAPDKKNYRRFRIKSFTGNDNFRAMEEVVGRRYTRLHEEGKPFPELLVIDGGQGQIASALRSFIEQELEPPFMIGLAKKHERVFFADGRLPLDLPSDSEARKLLQRVRDEAHRFANTYNADLRSRKIRESILDDFPGIGPAKRKALFDHFRTIERMKAASVEELAGVDGIGLKMAEALAAFLKG
jgi:excinuclease ABC subunit C